MKKSMLTPLVILGVLVIIGAGISWFAFPTWQARPGGIWELLGVVLIAAIALMTGVLGILKTSKELAQEEKTPPPPKAQTHAEGKGSVAIGGSANKATIITGNDNEIETKDGE